jgi:hypothetical protein
MKPIALCYAALVLGFQVSWADPPRQPPVKYSPEWVRQQIDRYFEAQAACVKKGKVLIGATVRNTLTTKCVLAGDSAYKAAQHWVENLNDESLKEAQVSCAPAGQQPEGTAFNDLIFYHCVSPSDDRTKAAIDVVPKGQDIYWIHVGGGPDVEGFDKQARQRARGYCAQMRRPIVVVKSESWDMGYGLTLTFTCVAAAN